jgi:hypothetical protein
MSRSRKQQQAQQPQMVNLPSEESSSLEQTEFSTPDAVINGIRFGMSKIEKLTEETIPQCPTGILVNWLKNCSCSYIYMLISLNYFVPVSPFTEDMKRSIASRMEACYLRLVRAETAYSKASSIVTDVVEGIPDDVSADAVAILKSCDKIAEVCIYYYTSMDCIAIYVKFSNFTERIFFTDV